jgi:hypothetical protein
MNATWHARHKLPRNASAAQRLRWHEGHQRACGCRPMPAALKEALRAAVRKSPGTTARRKRTARTGQPSEMSRASRQIDPRFAPVVEALLRSPGVTYGGKGFGSTALKLRGKLFAFISSTGRFVARLPRERVEALVRERVGKPFEPAPGRIMKEWLELDGRPATWLALATEAHRFAAGGSAPSP